MKKNIIFVIVFLGMFVALAGIGIISVYNNRVIDNEEERNGNTPGNILNGGSFCEFEGKIYFANPKDGNRLYYMNSDCTGIKKINNDTATYINAGGNSVIYVKDNETYNNAVTSYNNRFGICRVDLKGKNYTTYSNYIVKSLYMEGNTLYYKATDNKVSYKLYSSDIRGGNEECYGDFSFDANVVTKEKLYYINTAERNNIYSYDIDDATSKEILKVNAHKLIQQGNYLYYIDISDDYSLKRYNVSSKKTDVIVSGKKYGKSVRYNIYKDDVAFVQCENEGETLSTLYRVDMESGAVDFVAKANITDIQCTSTYTFYVEFETNNVYKVKTKVLSEPEKLDL